MKKLSEMSIFLFALLLFVAAHVYVLFRLWRLVPADAPVVRVAVVAVAVALSAAFFLGMAARHAGIPLWAASALYRVGTAWIIIFFYIAMAFLAVDILRLAHVVPRGVLHGNWLAAGVLTAVLVAVFVTGNIVYHTKRRVEITVEADVPRPIVIVAASDLHLGYGIGRRELARWVGMINAERPDAVLFAGDVVDSSTRPLIEGGMDGELRRIEAPLGVFAVPGNHEYISGIDASVRFLESAGIRVLRDSTTIIADGIAIVGRDDLSNRARKRVGEIVREFAGSSTEEPGVGLPTEGLAEGHPVRPTTTDQPIHPTAATGPPVRPTTILLDHQPTDLDAAARAGIDLQISGHTHRGQVWPATWISDRMFECSHGAFSKGGTRYYVSQGLGIWGGKFRLGSRSEYLVIKVLPGE